MEDSLTGVSIGATIPNHSAVRFSRRAPGADLLIRSTAHLFVCRLPSTSAKTGKKKRHCMISWFLDRLIRSRYRSMSMCIVLLNLDVWVTDVVPRSSS